MNARQILKVKATVNIFFCYLHEPSVEDIFYQLKNHINTLS